MTGNVTQSTLHLVDLLQSGSRDGVVADRIARMGPPIVAFAAGAIGAGLPCARFGQSA